MTFLLLPFALLYRSASLFREFLYAFRILKTRKAPLTVVSVGNISFGGSEKTPLCLHLISLLLDKGFRPALITRGYKGKWEKKGGVLSDGKRLTGGWREAGDEPYMAAMRFPRIGVFIGKNRLASCRRAADNGFDIAVLDDGFQHLSLERDIDIVLYHPSDRVRRREFESALNRADHILVKSGNGELPASHLNKFRPSRIFTYTVVNEGWHTLEGRPVSSIEEWKGKRLLAFCGIAGPERFAFLMEEMGLKPGVFLKFPDHHPYPPASLRKIEEKAESIRAEAALTTEKDAVKFMDGEKTLGIPLIYLKIGIRTQKEFTPEFLAGLGSGRET